MTVETGAIMGAMGTVDRYLDATSVPRGEGLDARRAARVHRT
jgi:hypothetical protein